MIIFTLCLPFDFETVKRRYKFLDNYNKIEYIMDVFQLIGDFLHLVAILLLLLKILASKNVVGLSYRTQELFIVAFISRYSDMILENHWGSMYFNLMRLIFISINGLTIYYMRTKRPYKLVQFE